MFQIWFSQEGNQQKLTKLYENDNSKNIELKGKFKTQSLLTNNRIQIRNTLNIFIVSYLPCSHLSDKFNLFHYQRCRHVIDQFIW